MLCEPANIWKAKLYNGIRMVSWVRQEVSMGAKSLQGSTRSLRFEKLSEYCLEAKFSTNLSIIIGVNHRYKNRPSGFHIIGRVTKRGSLSYWWLRIVCGDWKLMGSLLTWNWKPEDLPPNFIYKAFCVILRKTKSIIFVHFKEWRVWLPVGIMRLPKPMQVTLHATIFFSMKVDFQFSITSEGSLLNVVLRDPECQH